MQLGNIYRIIVIVAALIWILTVLYRDMSFFKKNWVFVINSVLFVFLLILHRRLFGLSLSKSAMQTFQTIIIVFTGIISIYYHENDFDFFKVLFPLLLISVIFFSITTITAIIDNPYAARIANREWLNERYEGNELVGLYGFVYMCVFLAPMLLYMQIKKVRLNAFTTFLTVVTLVITLFLVVVSGYMIAIFCCLGSCIVVLAFHNRSILRTIILLLSFLLFVLFYQNIIDALFSAIMDFTKDNPVYYNKFSDLRDLFLGSENIGETVEGRFSNYAASIQDMINYPLIGSYFFGETSGGGHSAILDMFGKFGFICGILMIYLFVIFPHKIGVRDKKYNVLDYSILIFTLVYAVLDPIPQEFGINIFIFMPFIISLQHRQSKEANK